MNVDIFNFPGVYLIHCFAFLHLEVVDGPPYLSIQVDLLWPVSSYLKNVSFYSACFGLVIPEAWFCLILFSINNSHAKFQTINLYIVTDSKWIYISVNLTSDINSQFIGIIHYIMFCNKYQHFKNLWDFFISFCNHSSHKLVSNWYHSISVFYVCSNCDIFLFRIQWVISVVYSI